MSAKVIVEKGAFAESLSIVGRAVASSPHLPILGNVLITGEGGQLRLAATNLTLGVSTWLEARLDGEVALTLPARTLTELVNSLADSDVQLAVNGSPEATLKCGAFKGVVRGAQASEFPPLPDHDSAEGVTLPASLLREMIQETAVAASIDESRAVLTGVQLSFDGHSLIMAATDGFRLAIRRATLPAAAGKQQVIIPAASLKETVRILSATRPEQVRLVLPPGGSQVVLRTENVQLVSQLIDGRFPDYQAIVPKDHKTRSLVATADLLKACKQAGIIARQDGNIVHLRLTPGAEQTGKVTVAAESGGTGQGEVELPATVLGQELQIAFNVRLLQDGLEAIRTPNVVIDTNSYKTPAVFRPAGREGSPNGGEEEYQYILMPMHVS